MTALQKKLKLKLLLVFILFILLFCSQLIDQQVLAMQETQQSPSGRILISKAFRLDENKNAIEDLFDTVKEKDNNWAEMLDGQYIRVTFEKPLTKENDITLFARPRGESAQKTVTVYLPDSQNPLIVFPEINQENTYQILLTDLQKSTATFDLKITGDMDIDWIVDPDPMARYWVGGAGNWSDAPDHWAPTSGGTASAENIPIVGDLVFFDQNSGSGTITIDASSVSVGQLNIMNPSIEIATSTRGITVTGNLSVMGTISGATAVIFSGSPMNNISGLGTISSPLTLTADATLNVSGEAAMLSISGVISGEYNLAKIGTGTVSLTGANTYTGATIINQGTISANKIVVDGGNSSLGNAATPIVLGDGFNTGTLVYTGEAGTYTRGFTISAGGGEIDNNGGTLTIGEGGITAGGALTIGGPNNISISSTISGAGSIIKITTTTLALSGVNTFTGGISLNVGTIIGSNDVNAFGDDANIITIGKSGGTKAATLDAAGALTFANPITVAADCSGLLSITGSANATFNGAITLANDLTVAPTANSLALSGSISGTGNIIMNGTGSSDVTLSGASINMAGTITNQGTTTGATTISGVIDSNVTGVTQNSATSQLTLSGNGSSVTGDITITDGTLEISGTTGVSLTGDFLNDSGLFTANSSTVTFLSGTHALTGASTFYNLTVNASNAITFPASTTQIIGNTFSCTGTADNEIVIDSSSAGTQATLSKASDTVSCDYLSLQDSATTGGADWHAGAHSLAISGVTGWDDLNTAPTISAGPSDGNSSSTTPTKVGSNVTFTATATDTQSDNYYLAICKTDAVTAVNNGAPTCDGDSWAISTSTASGAPATVTYTTLIGDDESNEWYAFVCDYNEFSECSASAQGAEDPGSPFTVDHAPGFSAIADSPDPTKLGANVTFSATASDPDIDGSADTVTLYVCKSNDFAGGACGIGGQWCNSTASASNPSCSYTALFEDGDSAHNYYAYIIDNHGFESAANPKLSTFTTDVTVPTITSISSSKTNGSYTVDTVIDIDVVFSEAVTSSGVIIITLETGDNDRTCTFTATNESTGTCNYTVKAGDTSLDLDATISGTITDQAGNGLSSYTPTTTLAASKELVIDTTTPTVEAGTNSTQKSQFTQNATVTDATSGIASYLWSKVSGSGTITFGTSAAEDTTISASVDDDYVIQLLSTDNAGNSATDTFNLTWDTTAPTITSISSSKTNGTYNAGTVIDIDVVFSEAITSTGDITITLETGDTDRTCTFTATNEATGTCNYTVQAGDTSLDLDATISGTIADQAGNALSNYTPTTTLAASKALIIDTTAPIVATLSPADDAESAGITSNLVITFSEAVDAETGNIVLYKSDNTIIQTFDVTADISGSGTTIITLDPTLDLSGSTAYYIKIDASAFDNAIGNSFAGIADTTTWNFTTGSTGRRYVAPVVVAPSSGSAPVSTPPPTTSLPPVDTVLPIVTIPNTEPTLDGKLIKYPDSPKVYLVENGEMRWIVDAKTFENLGYAWTDIQTVENNIVFNIGEVITEENPSYEGELIKYPDSPKVYLVENEEVRWIVDAKTFENLGYDWNDIQTVENNIIFNTGEVITEEIPSYEGELIKYNNSVKVYLIQNNLKSLIINEAAFNYYNYKWDAILTIKDSISFADGKNIVKPQGYIFTRDLEINMQGEDVRELQKYLNNNGFQLTDSSPGSPGNETDLFGSLTRSALIKFQQANNLYPAIGHFGSETRTKMNE